MDNKKNIPIFFTVDDGYIPFFAVVLESLIENSSKEYNYEIKVIYTQISEENQKRIKNKYDSENVDIEFVNIKEALEKISEKFYTRDYYSKATYYRLLIPELYPQYDKAIYLDSDVVVLGDISELYNIELEGNLLRSNT